jgi:Tfp pilus assembly protein PilF
LAVPARDADALPAARGAYSVVSCCVRQYFVWQVIGEWRKRRGELGSAREAYRRSLQLNKQNAATFHAWGVLEWRCGHHDLATQLFRKGLDASPHNRYILQSWACMEARAGRSDEAQRLFARALQQTGPARGGRRARRFRPDGATWQSKALHCRAEGSVSKARQCFERGVADDAKHVPLYHSWGQLELEQHNVSGARAIYQRGVWASRDERATSSLWTAWALLEERAGDEDAARRYLRQALTRDRFAVDVRTNWAAFEARCGNLACATPRDNEAPSAGIATRARMSDRRAEGWCRACGCGAQDGTAAL